LPQGRGGYPSTTPRTITRLYRTRRARYVGAGCDKPEMKVQRSIDRRANHRFRFMVPVLFRWADSTEHYDIGHSGNVGLGGMFILTSKCPPVGTEVEIDFAIPAFDRIPRQLHFGCKGQVTRVETCYEVAGFAVTGRIESGQLGDDIEEAAGSLLTRQPSNVLH
jgi:PilZ domain